MSLALNLFLMVKWIIKTELTLFTREIKKMHLFFFSIKTSPKPINQRFYSFQDIQQAESKASVSHRRWPREEQERRVMG